MIESKNCEAEIEEGSDYGEFFASSLSSYVETDDKCRENWLENEPKLNLLVALAQPIEYFSGFVTVQYNVPVDVVFKYNA